MSSSNMSESTSEVVDYNADDSVHSASIDGNSVIKGDRKNSNMSSRKSLEMPGTHSHV